MLVDTLHAEAVVGLEKIAYTVSENVGVVEVCTIVYSPSLSCPISHPFEVRFSTDDGTAGNFVISSRIHYSVDYLLILLYS